MIFIKFPTISSRIRRTRAEPFSVMQTKHFAPIFARARPHDVVKIFQPRDQATRRRGGVTHFLRDSRHGQHLFLIQRCEQEKLRKGNVARRQLLAETQDKAALHLEDDVRQPLGIASKIIGGIKRACADSYGVQPEEAKRAARGVNHPTAR